jgi:hypothetical protein
MTMVLLSERLLIMKRVYTFLTVLAVPVVLIFMSNSNGSVGGKSGSIGDNGHTCTDCHSGTATTKTGWITTNVPDDGYTPGQTYTITATGTHSGVVKFGFELTVEDSQGSKVGTLQVAEPTRTKLTNSSHAMTHTAAGNVPSGNTNTWTMNWVAPSNVTGDIGIYAAFNAANGNGNTSGDVIYKSSTFIFKAVPTPFLQSIQPDNAIQGESISVVILGTNTTFSGTPGVFLSFSGNGLETINASSVTVISATEIHAVFNVPSTASTGLWDLHVGTLVLNDAFTVNLATGIADNVEKPIKFYPNPSQDHFYIDDAAGSELSLFDSRGQMVRDMDVVSDKQLVNISQLSPGIYILKLKSGKTERVEKLLVN